MAEPATIRRFSRSERALHWLLAGTFLVMLASGMALYAPALAALVDRPTAKELHIDSALALLAGTALLFALRWRRLAATVAELERMDREDRRWLAWVLRLGRGPAPAQGRFNAGQKLNSALVAGLMTVLFLTGALLWAGERDTDLRFAGTVLVHDWAGWLLTVLVIGHLYLALVHRSTRHALRGMVTGEVDREWARAHHARWVSARERARAPGRAPRR